MKKFKKGGKATLLFHMYGIISKEQYLIADIEGDIITLDTDEDPACRFKFHASTGACVNDNNWGGAKRTLKI